MRLNYLALALVMVLGSCHTTKNTGKKKNIDLAPVEISVPRDNPYRGSATKDFDLIHTRLEVSFDYEKQRLNGKATLTLKPHFYSQNRLVLDAKQFDLHEVSVLNADNKQTQAEFDYDSVQLNITLPKAYKNGEELKVYIAYTAKPEERPHGGSDAIQSDKGLYFINPLGKDSSKPIQIWTQGETESSSCWFPTIDKPNQKTTQEIYITRDKKYVSLSNGVLLSSKENADGSVTDYWRMSLPHAPYLVMMTVGDFAIYKDRWRDLEVNYYTEHSHAPYAKQIFGNTPEMMEFFSQKLGVDYPWAKYSQIIVRDYVSGAMENTSATLHGDFLQRNSRELIDETYEDIISHELFHQWFGDLITCESWSNLPLNESFATYGEYLWNEYKYGREYADYKQFDQYYEYMSEAQNGKNVDLTRFYYADKEDMFDSHSYAKGGLLLHYLRHIVGDEAFFKSLETYLKKNSFKTAEVHDLRMAFEEVTGKDLNWFFNQWFFAKGHPVLDVTYSHTADSVKVEIAQKHNAEENLVYQLPLQIKVYYETNTRLYDVVLNKPSQVLAFKAEGTPLLTDIDPPRVVLCEKTESKTPAQYIYQLKNGSYKAQAEALEQLTELQKDNVNAKLAIIEALNASFFEIRVSAIDGLQMPKENNESILTTIETLAKADAKSAVRAKATEKLGKQPQSSKYTALFEAGLNDSSYAVVAASLKALAKADSKKAMQYAKPYENDKNASLVGAVADVYSREGEQDKQVFFEEKLPTANGINKYYLFYYYSNFLTRMDKRTVLTGIKTIEREGLNGNEWYLQAARGALKQYIKAVEDRKKLAQSNLSKEDGQTAKLTIQEQIADYEAGIAVAKDALQKLIAKQ